MADGFYFKDSELHGKIKIVNRNQSQILEALVDTGAFKTLIPESTCLDLNLGRMATKLVWGICPTPVKVNIYLAEVFFSGYKVINSVIGFDVPSGKRISLIGRDILSQFNITISNSDQVCQIRKL